MTHTIKDIDIVERCTAGTLKAAPTCTSHRGGHYIDPVEEIYTGIRDDDLIDDERDAAKSLSRSINFGRELQA